MERITSNGISMGSAASISFVFLRLLYHIGVSSRITKGSVGLYFDYSTALRDLQTLSGRRPYGDCLLGRKVVLYDRSQPVLLDIVG